MSVSTDTTHRVGTAVVGYGYWGVNLARNVAASSSLRLVGIADPDADRAKAATGNHPGVSIWSGLDDVLVAKPLAMTVEDGRDLVALADDRGLIAMVGHTFLYSAPVHRIKEYLTA